MRVASEVRLTRELHFRLSNRREVSIGPGIVHCWVTIEAARSESREESDWLDLRLGIPDSEGRVLESMRVRMPVDRLLYLLPGSESLRLSSDADGQDDVSSSPVDSKGIHDLRCYCDDRVGSISISRTRIAGEYLQIRTKQLAASLDLLQTSDNALLVRFHENVAAGPPGSDLVPEVTVRTHALAQLVVDPLPLSTSPVCARKLEAAWLAESRRIRFRRTDTREPRQAMVNVIACRCLSSS